MTTPLGDDVLSSIIIAMKSETTLGGLAYGLASLGAGPAKGRRTRHSDPRFLF